MITIEIEKSKKLNSEYSGFVSFQYNPDIVSVMRSLPIKFYYPNTRIWEIPVDKIEWLKDNLSAQNIKKDKVVNG